MLATVQPNLGLPKVFPWVIDRLALLQAFTAQAGLTAVFFLSAVHTRMTEKRRATKAVSQIKRKCHGELFSPLGKPSTIVSLPHDPW